MEFHQSAINTLSSPFTDPEALKAQLNDLANWARDFIPSRVFTAATETLDDEMYNWYAKAPTSPIPNYSQQTLLHDNLTILSTYIIFLTYTLLQYLYTFHTSNIVHSNTKRNPLLTVHRENRSTKPKLLSNTKRSKRRRIRRPHTTSSNTSNESAAPNLQPLLLPLQKHHRRKRTSYKLLQTLLQITNNGNDPGSNSN